jgi:hypothetical protein
VGPRIADRMGMPVGADTMTRGFRVSTGRIIVCMVSSFAFKAPHNLMVPLSS